MDAEMQLVIPMSGQGTRYRAAGHVLPKPLVDVNGAPMVARLLAQYPAAWRATFVMAENHRDTELPALLRRLRPEGRQLFVPPHTAGPGRALWAALPHLPEAAPVLVSYCDFGMVWDAAAFARFVAATACDAALVTYRGFHAHYLSPTPYAYARLAAGRVVEVREKGCFTADREAEHASAGAYYFRTAAQLRAALDWQMGHNLALNGELYTSLTVQALLQRQPGADVRVFQVPAFFQWGTPQDLDDFVFWERSCTALGRGPGAAPAPRVAQVVMPMAGLGSRFAPLSPTPKPLLPLDERPMFVAALDHLPGAERTVVVALEAMRPAVEAALRARAAGAPAAGTACVVGLERTPPGQALSTRAALPHLAPALPVLVSACDHGVALEAAAWAAFVANPDCDAAIVTVRGTPGARRRPQAYSYVVPAAAGDAGPFPLVGGVSVKRPATADPAAEPLLLGTFWFRSAAVLGAAIDALVAADLRVNGELYLDSALELMCRAGQRVRHLPVQGFANWGDPDSLAEALYWSDVHGGRQVARRPRLPDLRPPPAPPAAAAPR